MAESADAVWRRREVHRKNGVAAVKASAIYLDSVVLAAETEELNMRRPVTPDVRDRAISKRSWETAMKEWRRNLSTFVGSGNAHWLLDSRLDIEAAHFRDTCLISALTLLGYDVAANRNGPLQVVVDGNIMLASFGKCLVPANMRTPVDGDYILVTASHSSAVKVIRHLAWLVRSSGSLERVNLGALPDAEGMRLFRIESLGGVLSTAACEATSYASENRHGVPWSCAGFAYAPVVAAHGVPSFRTEFAHPSFLIGQGYHGPAYLVRDSDHQQEFGPDVWSETQSDLPSTATAFGGVVAERAITLYAELPARS